MPCAISCLQEFAKMHQYCEMWYEAFFRVAGAAGQQGDFSDYRIGQSLDRSPTIERPADAGTVEDGCALDVARHILARVGLCFPSAALRSPAVFVDPVGVPARLRAGSQARPRERESAGRKRAASGAPARSPAAEVGAMPTWHRNSLGVGRVARRARPVTKPYSRPLPRLTLKAGHKEGLPTNPTAACGAMSPSVRAVPFLNEMHPNTEYYQSEYS